MDAGKERTWIQCTNCGHIYIVDRKISINMAIIRSSCPRCKWGRGYNCGHNELDIAELYDPYLDERYFDYSK